jgi:hypothetical protein
MTSGFTPEDFPSGDPSLSGREAADGLPLVARPAAPARDAARVPRTPQGGISGTPEHAGRAHHPCVLPAFKPANGRPSAQAEDGPPEPLASPEARARKAPAAAPDTAAGDPSLSRPGSERDGAGPDAPMSGPAQTSLPVPPRGRTGRVSSSPPLLRGHGGDEGGGSGGDAALAAGSSPATNSAGGARPNAAPSAGPPALSGHAWRDAERAVKAANAKTRRNGRGKRAAKPGGSRYVPGANRRNPPGSAA